MPEPDWERDVRDWIAAYVGGSDGTQDYAFRCLRPYIDAAYHRGLIAGRSQSGYTTRRKPRERKEENSEVGQLDEGTRQ